MRKILVLLFGLLMNALLVSQNIPVAGNSLQHMKAWQLKGMARSALRIGDVYQARDLLSEWNRREPNNQMIKLKLAVCLFQSRDYEKAAGLFNDLWQRDPDNFPQAGFYSALIYKIQGNYELALDILQPLRRRYRKLTGIGLTRSLLDNEIAGCHMGMASRDTVVNTLVVPFNETINSPLIEFSPLLLGESAFVYGTVDDDSSRFIDLSIPYSAKRVFRQARLIDEVWTGGFNPDPPFYNHPEFDTGRGVFSVDRKRFYSVRCAFNRNGQTICHLYVSVLEDNVWSQPQKLPRQVNHPRFNSTHPAVGTCFDPNVEVLYFVSDRKGGGGGKDIWFSVFNKHTQSYTKAENAGVFINTSQDEITPFFDFPSHRLYFSSNGWPSMGGFDLFYAKGDMSTWELPVNLGRPRNSSYDDLNLIQNFSAKLGLFASNRPGSLSNNQQACCDDLYLFTETESPRVLITGKLVKEDIIRGSGIFNPKVSASDMNIDDEVLRNQLVTIQLVQDSTSSVILQEIQTNDQGEFEVWLDPGSDYQISVDNSSLVNNKFSISTKNVQSDETLDVSTISLTSVNTQPIVIDNIYYEFDQTELTSEAKTVLDTTLLVLLSRYPSIQVEIASHTDNIGDEKYNQRLSERRANSVVKYLIFKGVSKNRLSAIGYGESHPVYPNQNNDGSDNPVGRNKNRRTEFKITGLNNESVFKVNNQ